MNETLSQMKVKVTKFVMTTVEDKEEQFLFDEQNTLYFDCEGFKKILGPTFMLECLHEGCLILLQGDYFISLDELVKLIPDKATGIKEAAANITKKYLAEIAVGNEWPTSRC